MTTGKPINIDWYKVGPFHMMLAYYENGRRCDSMKTITGTLAGNRLAPSPLHNHRNNRKGNGQMDWGNRLGKSSIHVILTQFENDRKLQQHFIWKRCDHQAEFWRQRNLSRPKGSISSDLKSLKIFRPQRFRFSHDAVFKFYVPEFCFEIPLFSTCTVKNLSLHMNGKLMSNNVMSFSDGADILWIHFIIWNDTILSFHRRKQMLHCCVFLDFQLLRW